MIGDFDNGFVGIRVCLYVCVFDCSDFDDVEVYLMECEIVVFFGCVFVCDDVDCV